MDRVNSAAALLIGSDVATLTLLPPRWTPLATHLAHPRGWLAEVGTDPALTDIAGTALWIAAAWLAVGLLAAGASRLPGAAGRASAVACRALLPRAVRGLIAGSAGLGVLLAPVAAGAASTHGSLPRPATAVPAPGWPVTPPDGAPTTTATPPSDATSSTAPPSDTGGPSSVPPPVWPATPSTATPPTVTPPAHPPTTNPPSAAPTGGRDSGTPRPSARPGPADAPPSSPPPAHGQPTAGGSSGHVTVQPGDCLWLIAARRLGPQASAAQIDAEWPRWYAANEGVVGADPGLIRPGQVLHAPPSAHDTEEATR
jgi:hypothetical protein